MKVDWTDDLIGYITRKWKMGWSAAMIARGLFKDEGVSCSRNAVIGKLHRLSLPSPAKQPKATDVSAAAKEKKATRGSVKPPPPPKVEANIKPPTSVPDNAWEVLAGSSPQPIERMERGACKWPVGDAPFLFCCNATEETYCETHRMIAYRGLPSKPHELARSLRRYL